MAEAKIKLWSGLSAQKSEVDQLLDQHLRDLPVWREVVRRTIPPEEMVELNRWAVLQWDYKATEDYAIVAVIAVVTLNRPDRKPKDVLELLQYAGSARGLFLEAAVLDQA